MWISFSSVSRSQTCAESDRCVSRAVMCVRASICTEGQVKVCPHVPVTVGTVYQEAKILQI